MLLPIPVYQMFTKGIVLLLCVEIISLVLTCALVCKYVGDHVICKIKSRWPQIILANLPLH